MEVTKTICSILIVILLIASIYTDYKYRKIYDVINLGIAGVGLVQTLLVDGCIIAIERLVLAVLMLIIILCLTCICEKKTNRHIAGGGDIKYIAALYMLLGDVIIVALILEFIYEKVLYFKLKKEGISVNDYKIPLAVSLGTISLIIYIVQGILF